MHTARAHGREAEALALSQQGIWLTAWSGNTKALGFYAAQEYEDLGLTHYEFEGQQFENRVLGRSLRDASPSC